MTKRAPKKEPKVLTDAELRQQAIDNFFNDPFKTQIALQPKPTRTYEIGEEVRIGNLTKTIVQEVFEDGMSYLCSYTRKHRDGVEEGYRVNWWFDIDKAVNTQEVPRLFVDYKQFNAINSVLASILHNMQHGGLVCDPEYQRDYVWSEENKDALLDSMFKRLDIGAFLLINHSGYLHECSNESKVYKTLSGETVSIPRQNDYTTAIIDGQQRLTTIFDFVMDRRPYRGVYFSQMNRIDQHKFLNTSVMFRNIKEDQVTKKDVLRMFLQSNRGVPQAPEHILKVQAMYDSCVD